MKSGCIILVVFIALAFFFSIFYCGKSLYTMTTTEIPNATAAVNRWADLYNANDFTTMYSSSDSALKKSNTQEKFAEQMKRLKDMTGNIKIGKQVGANMRVLNKEKYIQLKFVCKGEKGDVLLVANLHDELGWKIQGINFTLK